MGSRHPPPAPPIPTRPSPVRPNSGCVFSNPGNYSNYTGDPKNGIESCTDQAGCLDVYMDGGTCTTVTGAVGGTAWLYCQVCLYWSNDRGSCVKSTQDTVSHVCMADQFYPVIATSGGQPTVGNTAKLYNWNDGVGDRYCQWVRWNSSNYDTEVVRFTVKDGSGACRDAASPLQVTLQGISATCQSPRVVNNTLAGCGTGDQTNECLWTFNVTIPGAPRQISSAAIQLAQPTTVVSVAASAASAAVACTAQPSASFTQATHPSTAVACTAQPSASFTQSTHPSTAVASTTQPSASFTQATHPSTAVACTAQPSASVTQATHPSTAVASTTQPSASFTQATHPSTAVACTAQPSASFIQATHPSTAVACTAQPSASFTQATHPSTAVACTAQPSASVTQATHPSTAVASTTQPSASFTQATHPSTAVACTAQLNSSFT
ncbi:hypothetical protein PLESTF_000834700 [Pleodorina starrii]|nr:hypothetical protein PLESTF_000834700 [Pleodorina starrii]